MKMKATFKATWLVAALMFTTGTVVFGQQTEQKKAGEQKPALIQNAKPNPVATQSNAPQKSPAPGKSSVPGKERLEPDETNKMTSDIPVEAQANRRESVSEEEALIEPYYNNFFSSYKLGPEDVITVTVFGQERYSRNGIVIPPNGKISMPLVPEGIFVVGKTVDQVAEQIRKRYDEYIIDPKIDVSLEKGNSYRYVVLGDVAQPGVKPMTRRLTVFEAISEAGGVTSTGNKKKVYILRRQTDGMLTPIPVNISAIGKGRAPDVDYLVPGDQIVVPGNTLKKVQTVLGLVQSLSFARIFAGGIIGK